MKRQRERVERGKYEEKRETERKREKEIEGK